MSEIALYRKYRPKKLKGIVGQDHIKQYFQNAVSKNKISHAYLLSGTRGVGKTTIARIISLIVNCENGPSIDYDIKSKICSAILDNGAAGDVIELDAATNSSIDNIREIRKQAMTYPVMCRKRVFIIDEAHVLKNIAAGALLHILEEPPESSMFILATTESHKILPTIKSRCQKFELKTLSVAEISSYLTKICNNEGYEKIENGAMRIIAQAARGSIRDSLSILEPILSRCEGSSITVDIVRECIGSRLGQFFFCDLLENIVNKKSREAIVSIKKAIGSGMEPINIFNDLLENSHGMMLCQSLGSNKFMYIEDESKEKWESLTKSVNGDILTFMTKKISDYVNNLRYVTRPDIALDTCIVEILNAVKK